MGLLPELQYYNWQKPELGLITSMRSPVGSFADYANWKNRVGDVDMRVVSPWDEDNPVNDMKNYLNFGRAGYGSISAVSNLIMINKLTNLPNLIEDLEKKRFPRNILKVCL